MKSKSPTICLLGSINMDLVVRCRALPRPGETILADSLQEICGGKGANQAVAAARAGGEVKIIGRVGDDVFAPRLITGLEREQIDVGHIRSTADCSSGVAIVSVDAEGENSIMVIPGANGRLTPSDVAELRPVIESVDVLLMQLEVPTAAVLAGLEIARQKGVRVILDPAPAPASPAKSLVESLLQVDLICPNESEAATLVGHAIASLDDARQAARRLHELGAKQVVITLGKQGALLFDGAETVLVEPYRVTVADSTAAGDAFAGALAVFWAETNDLVRAVQLANAAGALAASRAGAQPSIPTRDEIESLGSSQP